MADLNDINNRISDRSECFYWQTDRKISVEGGINDLEGYTFFSY